MLEYKYDQFADTYLESRGLFPIQDVLEFFRLNLNMINGRLLDLGCGTGDPVCKFFIDKGWSVIGVDFSQKMIQIANKNIPEAIFKKDNMANFDMGTNTFNAITAVYSLFHLKTEAQSKVFRNSYRALKPGGKLLFTYATKDYTGKDEFAGEIDFLNTTLPYYHKTETDLENELRDIGFSIDASLKLLKGGERFLWVIAGK